MEDIKMVIAKTALNKMFKERHFSICTIDSVAEVLNVHPQREAYVMLRALHCIDYASMPSELRASLPELVRRCLSLDPIYQFEFLHQTVKVTTTARLMGLLGGGK